MATKYGKEAIAEHAARQARFKKTRNTVFIIVALIVIALVVDHYIF